MIIENHLLPLFLPKNSKLIMLGSFPPKCEKWSMDFYYPNIQNDMWRIFGLIFFKDKNYFLNQKLDKFDKNKIIKFLIKNKIALGDVGQSVIRLKDNASDKFLSIVKNINLEEILSELIFCNTIVSTGLKSLETLYNILNIKEPLLKTGSFITHITYNRELKIYRMPSTSRAYPLKLENKAAIYETMFKSLNII